MTIGTTPTISGAFFNGTATSKLIFRKNLTFGNITGVGDLLGNNIPSRVDFDGSAAQVITFNAGATFNRRFNNVFVGVTNSPTVTVLNGTANNNIFGNLTVDNSAVLDLGISRWNRNAAGGKITLAGTSTLVLGAGTGGQGNSNFPSGFSQFGDGAASITSFNATSTVEYNGTVAQTIFATPIYGNLTVSKASVKTAGNQLTLAGNLLINPTATFASNGATGWTHNIAGNFTNNGAFTFVGGTTNTINFNGNNNATISGSSATGFHTINVNKGASIATTLDLTSTATVASALNFTHGLLRIQPTGSMTVNGSGPNIVATSGLHVNGGIFNTIGVSVDNAGLFNETSGTANIGTVTGNSLNNNSGGIFDMSGGTLNLSGRLTFSTGAVPTSNLSGGNINLATVGNSSVTATLDMTGPTKINVSGGLITFKNANTGTGGDVNILFTTGAKPFTGGTMQFGTVGTRQRRYLK